MDSNLKTAAQSTTSVNDPKPRYISDETALGQKLNHAVHQQQRADFGFLLALLSDNVLEHSAQALRRQQTPTLEWQPPFAFGPTTPLAAQDKDFLHVPGMLFQQSRADWRLHHALRPEGLNPVNDPAFIPPQVYQNYAHYVQTRLQDSAQRLNQSDLNYTMAENSGEHEFETHNLLDIIDSLRGVERAVA